VMSRLGYAVSNDVLVSVPVFRSRTRMKDVVIDLVAIPLAACRVARRRSRDRSVRSAARPVAAAGAIAALLSRRRATGS